MARRLYLTGKYKKRYVVVDDEDYEYLRAMGSWSAINQQVSGRQYKGRKYNYPWPGYVHVAQQVFGKSHFYNLHRVVAERKYGYECQQGYQVDHINHNPRDNRRQNIRYIPREQNVRRTAQNGKGYIYDAYSNRWCVRFSRTDPFTKKKKWVFSRYCKTENEARLVSYLYKKGYTIPPKKRGRKCQEQKQGD